MKVNKQERGRIFTQVRAALKSTAELSTLVLEGINETAEEDFANIVYRVANRWTDVLLDDDDTAAATIGLSIYKMAAVSVSIDQLLKGQPWSVAQRNRFWSTSLGQLVFRRNGFPNRPATLAEAAAILRVTQQAVSAMKHRGVLRHRQGRIFRSSLYAAFQERYAVKQANLQRRMGEGVEAIDGDREFERYDDFFGVVISDNNGIDGIAAKPPGKATAGNPGEGL